MGFFGDLWGGVSDLGGSIAGGFSSLFGGGSTSPGFDWSTIAPQGYAASEAVTAPQTTGLFGGGSTAPQFDFETISPGGYNRASLNTLGEPGVAEKFGGDYNNWFQRTFGEGGGAAAGAAGASGGGKPTSWMDWANLGLKGLGAGMGIASGIQNMNLGAEQMKILREQQKRQAALAAPAARAGEQLTSAGALAMLGGALPEQWEAKAQEYEDKLRMDLRQYLARTGQSESTAAIDFEGRIRQLAAAYRAQIAQDLLQSGYAGIGTALAPSQSVSGTASSLVNASMGSGNTAQSNLWKVIGQS